MCCNPVPHPAWNVWENWVIDEESPTGQIVCWKTKTWGVFLHSRLIGFPLRRDPWPSWVKIHPLIVVFVPWLCLKASLVGAWTNPLEKNMPVNLESFSRIWVKITNIWKPPSFLFFGALKRTWFPPGNKTNRSIRSALPVTFWITTRRKWSKIPCTHLSREKNPLTFHYTGCLIEFL